MFEALLNKYVTSQVNNNEINIICNKQNVISGSGYVELPIPWTLENLKET